MAKTSFNIELFTPAGLAYRGEASEVIVPGSDGEVGVLPRHTKYVGLLGAGQVRISMPNGELRRFGISGGFCSYRNETFTVLADALTGE